MNIDNQIKIWSNMVNESTECCKSVDETNYPCTDGFPQAEKDICSCPFCGDKMYESDKDQKPEETSSEDNTKEDQLTLKQLFQKSRKEDGVLQIHFYEVTSVKETERTAIVSNIGAGYSFLDSKVVSPEKLKTIMKNHDRVFVKTETYTGCLVTFPENVTDHPERVHSKVFTADDGTKWQWTRCYIQEMIDVTYNGKVVWKNDDELFNYNLIGKKKDIIKIVSKEELDKMEAQAEAIRRSRERDKANYRLMHKKAIELAKNLTEEDCSVDLGYSITNGWDSHYINDYKIMLLAIAKKHDELERTNPEKHSMYNASSHYDNTRGFHTYKCKGCNFSYSVDSSD